ncbi:MAG: cyclic pyranopterin monophosphate synthase MoaC [Dehalococcoidia bacterium]|nr:cyclic pyranopterin monophosphate synthase MoaC [Dehalococcoidia bacterium]
MGIHDISMIDVTGKKITQRSAMAKAHIHMSKDTLSLVKENKIPKGNVLTAAQTAGILAAKRTPELIPLCHPLLISGVTVDFDFMEKDSCIEITSTVNGDGKTGFEMEALTAVSIAALTVYDMCKMFDKRMTISDLRLIKKTGGKSGTYLAERY